MLCDVILRYAMVPDAKICYPDNLEGRDLVVKCGIGLIYRPAPDWCVRYGCKLWRSRLAVVNGVDNRWVRIRVNVW